jgi:hypothetical protein
MAAARIALPANLPFDLRSISRVAISACGTAYYAALIGKYWLERYARLPVEIDVASEFRYRDPPLADGNLAVFVSQSGETADNAAGLRPAGAAYRLSYCGDLGHRRRPTAQSCQVGDRRIAAFRKIARIRASRVFNNIISTGVGRFESNSEGVLRKGY